MPPRVAILIPCYNEAATIAQVLQQAHQVLPHAQLVVCDNNSRDATAALAALHGALVLHEPRQGKGFAVQRMFMAVEADTYVLLDGDATYDLTALPAMLSMFQKQYLAMLVGVRQPQAQAAYRAGHQWGNLALTRMLAILFSAKFTDILSGYRIFSRAFVKSFPVTTGGFTIESAITVHALQLGLPCGEMPTAYFARPAGSHSKLNTWRDGTRIATYIIQLFVNERPAVFYGSVGVVLVVFATVLFLPLLQTYLATGWVPRIPTLLVAASSGVAALLSGLTGVVLQAIRNTRQEAKTLAYLNAASRQSA
jgi:glycosyltransferase involved in cell wall biosynthesis